MKIAILGPGAIGGLLASLFWDKGYEVVCVDRPERIAQLNKIGLILKSNFFKNLIAMPRFVSALDIEPSILFITVKAPFLESALKSIDVAFLKNSTIVPLLNGIEHLDVLKNKFGERVYAATIGCVESFSPEIGVISHLSKNAPCVSLQNKNGVEIIVEALQKIGVHVSILENEKEVLWSKFARLSTLAAVTAASGQSIGFAVSNTEWKKILNNFAFEVSQIALAEGVNISHDEIVDQLASLPPDLKSSLQKDLEAGRPSELDALIGALIRKGKAYDIVCPTIESIIKKINDAF